MRNYTEILAHIFQSYPMYHRIGTAAYKEGLENIEFLAEMAQHPEKKIKTVHIAGTNGKGSVAHLLSSFFQELGLKVGLFTSPHLVDFRERIKINGVEIPEKAVVDFFDKHQSKIDKIEPSFFEITTILAFDYFANNEIDIAIIETGLGGRLDATNIITPILSVITNISLEHTKLLGNTLQEIAFEKAGIIKPNIPVVIGEYDEETYPVFEKVAKEKNAPLILAEKYSGEIEFGGDYQLGNLGTFVSLVYTLIRLCVYSVGDFEIELLIEKSVSNVVINTGLRGRWEILQDKPLVICDVAHNPAAIKLVMNQLSKMNFRNLHIVLGFANDKNMDEIVELLPKNAHYYLCQANIERAMNVDELFNIFTAQNLKAKSYNSVLNAYSNALEIASENDVIFVGGSFFVVGELFYFRRSNK